MSNQELLIRLKLLQVQLTGNPADFPFYELQTAMPQIALRQSVDNIWRRLGR